MHNIAEGFDSETNAEFTRFLRYAKVRGFINYLTTYKTPAKKTTVNREP